MKRTMLFTALIALFIMPVSQAQASDRTFWSTSLGAALGGYIGSTIGKGRGNLAATAAGTFIGASIGNSYGRSIDRSERHTYRSPQPVSYYAPAYRTYRPNYVAPVVTQEPQPYLPPKNYRHNSQHSICVEKGYMGQYPHNQRRKGRHCREFTQTIRIDGEIKESYGIVCLRPDGSWQIQR